MVVVSRNGKRQIEPLCVLGMLPVDETGVVIAGGLSEIQRMVEAGEMTKPEGYIPPSKKITELIEGEDDDRK